jgi:2,3-bisphosphoglycerate-independent phosphoglycerate mutase
MAKNGPTALVILDGYGKSNKLHGNAVAQAELLADTIWLEKGFIKLLDASGEAVGLRPGMMGNSRAGHLTIGSGQKIEQPILRIDKAIADKSFFTNPALTQKLNQLASINGRLHIITLLSTGGVHAALEHLQASIELLQNYAITTFLHLILDGRDTSPTAGKKLVEELEKTLAKSRIKIGSLQGRWYAMDRNNNTARTEASYQLLTNPDYPVDSRPAEEIITQSYQQGITDEYLKPVRLDKKACISNHDGVLFLFLREDRTKQLINACLSGTVTPAWYLALTSTKSSIPTLYPDKPVENCLLDQANRLNLPFCRVYESEKEGPLIYFFNGCKEISLSYETRIAIPSYTSKTMLSHPEMRAKEITDAVLLKVKEEKNALYIINYANPDMVGHTGNVDATVKALLFLYQQLERLYTSIVTEKQGTLIITADHGKAEQLIDPITKGPFTAHTCNQVPLYFFSGSETIGKQTATINSLADITPFILNTCLKQ